MIHLLEVSPKLTVKELKKLARRYAMTGGYELALAKNLTVSDLRSLFSIYQEELLAYSDNNTERRSSNAYRILKLVSESDLIDTNLRDQIDRVLRSNE